VHKNLEYYLPSLINSLSENIPGDAVEAQWLSIIESFFSPAKVSKINKAIAECLLADDKRILYIPSIENSNGYELKCETKETFSDNDPALAQALLKLSCQFISVQQAAEQGAADERQRIARDLHDDVAARLLTLIHKAEDQDSIKIARSTLRSLRNAIYTLDNKSTTTILDALMDLRAEIQERLNLLGIQLFWQHQDDITGYIFTPRQHINLQRILHEITTNIIRHAKASNLSVNINIVSNNLQIKCCDDGEGFDETHCLAGKGLNNIRVRVDELKGQVNWSENNPQYKGCCVDIEFPITIKTEN